jgi:pimeloyl-ACP methyl ester carboxylesterase
VRVFLIHGMGRTSASMMFLSRRLEKAGHAPSSFGYFVLRDPLESIASRFVAHVEKHAEEGEPYAVVGHSLGNVITRLCLARLTRLQRFIMLAPPNRPPVMARALEKNPVFRGLTRDAGEKLLDPRFYERLPVPSCPALVVAGTRGPSQRFLPFQGEPSDGVVLVEETRLPGVPHVEVPAIHTFIMNDAQVAALTLTFLEHGTLSV